MGVFLTLSEQMGKKRQELCEGSALTKAIIPNPEFRVPFATFNKKPERMNKGGGESRISFVSTAEKPSVDFELFSLLPPNIFIIRRFAEVGGFIHPLFTPWEGCTWLGSVESSLDLMQSEESAMSIETSSVTSEVKYRGNDADRPRQFKHWVRPRSALYSYLYDYHRNYYDDVLDYLDRRRRGIIREIPRPQTWAERALRTYTQKLGTTENAIKARNDLDLIHRLRSSRVLHDFHSRDYNSKRFTMYLF